MGDKPQTSEVSQPKRKIRVIPKKPVEPPPASVPDTPTLNPPQPFLITDPESLFQCQVCSKQLKQWLLYIDQPCPRLCQCCVKCLFDQGSCGVCGRVLSQAEKEMVRIYYETFVPEDWPVERILAE